MQQRVLVVDDDPAIGAFFIDFLEHYGYQVRTAPDGLTGLALFQAESFHIVLVDFYMPGLTGLELATAIRQLAPSIPMALITGTVHALDLRQVAQAGIARIFQKPFHLEEILAWLQLLGVASTPPP